MSGATLQGGFETPANDAAHAFRAIMETVARPGRIERLAGARAPAPLSPAAAVTLLTLCDADTPLWIAPDHDTPDIRAWVAFHTGAPLVPPDAALFAIGRWNALLPLARFARGTPDYPDRSATLIVETDRLANDGAVLRGPGILGTAHLSLPEHGAFQENARGFPLGLDFLFTCGDRVAALPRSTEVA